MGVIGLENACEIYSVLFFLQSNARKVMGNSHVKKGNLKVTMGFGGAFIQFPTK